MPKPRKTRGRRGRAPSPLQKALEPGSQDNLRGPPIAETTPLTTPGVDVSQLIEKFDPTSLGSVDDDDDDVARARDDSCLGPNEEQVDHQHTYPEAVAQHLHAFLNYLDAAGTIATYGVELVNIALAELPLQENLRTQRGWLTWRIRKLAQGDPPMRLTEKTETHQDPRTLGRLAEMREADLKEEKWPAD